MPMVGRGYKDGIDVLILQYFPEILFRFGGVPDILLAPGAVLRENVFVDVAVEHQLGVAILVQCVDMGLAPAVKPRSTHS